MAEPFAVTDCALISIATGEKAQNLRELRDRLLRVDQPAVMYYHFWDVLLRPQFADPEYQNDFAAWVYHELHDRRLAERLSIINPKDFRWMDDLRQKLVDVIEERMDEVDFIPQADVEHPFFFMRSQIVVFDTGIRIDSPAKLAELIPQMSSSSIFYHFIDSRRRTASGKNDFTEWLWDFEEKYADLADAVDAIDPYFSSLTEVRSQLSAVFANFMKEGE
jgi:hypothetical protein